MVAAKSITTADQVLRAPCNLLSQYRFFHQRMEDCMGIIWAIIIGFLAGLIAKWITPGNNKPSGFILTTVLGIVGSVLATWLWQQISPGDVDGGVGLLSGIIGAVIILLAWGQIARRV
jgi:uncharacterized membrane protein YeaQ/YmgE (transglycosylase-associated protein family)